MLLLVLLLTLLPEILLRVCDLKSLFFGNYTTTTQVTGDLGDILYKLVPHSVLAHTPHSDTHCA